jgi:copper transport protein
MWVTVFLFSIVFIQSCGAAPSSTLAPTPQQSSSQEVAHPFHSTLKTLDAAFTITLDITPDRTGTNVFTMHVMNNQTGEAAMHIQVTLYLTMQDMAMGTNSLLLQDGGKGLFSATGDNLSMAGHWAVGIAIQTTDQIIHKVGVSFVTFP